jgi:hypothetical protein
MPWFRIDESAIDHPKFLAISANAWRLWCEGGTYCQRHLTDGVILRAALKGFRYYSTAALKELTTAIVPGKGPLWHDEDERISVHDYLDYNDSRAEVLKAREQGKERKRRYLDRHASENAFQTASETRSASRSVGCSPSQQANSAERGERGTGETREQRAGNFCEWYSDTHARLVGVGYIGNPRKDYEAALLLVAKFTDAELQDAAIVWFGQRDAFATNGTRTVTKFASRASVLVVAAREVAS